MAGRTRVLSLVEDKVIEGYKNGMTLRELAELYECSAGTVRNLLISKNIVVRSRGRIKNKVSASEPLQDENGVEETGNGEDFSLSEDVDEELSDDTMIDDPDTVVQDIFRN